MVDFRTLSFVDFDFNIEATITENRMLRHNNKILIGTVIFIGLALAVIYVVKEENKNENYIFKNVKS
jgi:hypothetical protein